MNPSDFDMPITEPFRSWYALYTRSRFENVVFQGLCKKSLEAFLPRIRVKSRRRDRTRMIQVPLFPGYLFVKTDLNPKEYIDILRTVGVVRMMGGKGGPVPVGDSEIESLKIMTLSESPIISRNCMQKGDRVVVVNGAFAGVVGVFVRYRGKERVAVNIDALGQSAIVDVSAQDVEKAPPISSYRNDSV